MSPRTWFRLVALAGLLAGFVVSAWTPPSQGKAHSLARDESEVVRNSVGMKLARIPAGKFKRGSPKEEREDVLASTGIKEMPDWLKSEGPQHRVEITRTFYLGSREVTQEQFEEVMGYNPSYFSHHGKGKSSVRYKKWHPHGGRDKVKGEKTGAFPVENVSWDEAREFCAKLSERRAERRAGRKYRLPTEAEWEYACRAGRSSSNPFHFGKSLSSTQANFNGNGPYGGGEKGVFLDRTCKVGSYRGNAWGLHDMHGNVWEWCRDWYDRSYYKNAPEKNPHGPRDGKLRVLRGGCWLDAGWSCRSACRNALAPDTRAPHYGFRVACVIDRE